MQGIGVKSYKIVIKKIKKALTKTIEYVILYSNQRDKQISEKIKGGIKDDVNTEIIVKKDNKQILHFSA